jgi:RND family efflux transporter MFP subunit
VLAACAQAPAERPAPLVATVVVGPGSAAVRRLTGEVRAQVDSPLAFRVAGQIIERPVRRGQVVRRGQMLARIDAVDIGLAAAEAQAQAVAAGQAVASARAAAARAAADEARLRPLVGAGGISPQAYDQAKAAAEAAAADLAGAQARLAAAQASARRAGNQNRHATLLADADGIVVDLLAEPGEVVQSGQPVVRLARAGARDAVVAVPEAMRGTIPRAATATVYGSARRYVASLREVTGAADPRTRSFEARYSLDGAADVPPGATVTLELDAGRATPVAGASLTVPLGALIDRGRGHGVWVIGAKGVVAFRPVHIAAIRDEQALVTGTLRAGERVVALGAHMLSEGQRVRMGSLPR